MITWDFEETSRRLGCLLAERTSRRTAASMAQTYLAVWYQSQPGGTLQVQYAARLSAARLIARDELGPCRWSLNVDRV